MHLFRAACLFISLVLGAGGLFAEGNTTKISAAEYFVDTDPGEGSGTALTAQDGAFDSEVEAIAPVDLNVTGLSVGPHLIGIRYKDDNNTWGDVLYQTIHVYDANPSASGAGSVTERVWPPSDGTVQTGTLGQTSTWTVSGASYGNGTYSSNSSKSLHEWNSYNAFDGIHDGQSWHTSQNDSSGILAIELPSAVLLTKYEIFNRTGYSSSDYKNLPKDWSFEGSNDGIIWSVLDSQTNQVTVAGSEGEASKRSYSLSNNHSAFNHYRINVSANNGGSYLILGELKLYGTSPVNTSVGFATITGAEYFVDTDPGEGNGTAFQPQDGAFDSEVESILPKDLNVTGLSVGPHLVGVRYKDNNNTWGDVLYQTIHVYDANPSGSGSGSVTERVWPPSDGTVQTGTLGQTSTWTVSGASYGNGTYTAGSSITLHGGNTYKAFDGTHDQGSWHSTAGITTGILTLELPEAFVLSKYELYRRISNQGPNNDNSFGPQNWTLEGSNDGTNWTVLDTQTNQTFASGVEGEASKKSYSISNNSTTYNKYRINVTANSGGSYLILGELKLYGTSPVNTSVGFTTITGAEYFVDTDPGEGSGTAFQPKDGAFDSEVEAILPKDLNVTGLSVGPHLVGVRYKDNNNTWGDVLYQTIHVYDANPSGSGSGGSDGGGSGGSSVGFATISAAEYFVDTDPGEGSGTAFQPQDGAFDSEVESILPKDLNVTGLSVGPHLVGVRYKDNNNTWGDVLYQTIHVYDANPSGSGSGGSGGGGSGGSSVGFATITAAEYFVDTDPGEGSGTAFQPKDGAFDSEVESIVPKDLNVTGLSVGPHLVGVRYKDNNNTWGDVLYQTIHVYDANPSGSGSGGSGGGGSGGSSVGFATITAAEYFVDTDPGEGSGTAFQPKDGAFDSEVESILPKDLNVTGLSVGPHLVGVRYKDNSNIWGDVLYQTIHVYDANPDANGTGSGGTGGTGGFSIITGAEYFIGTDPGEGNANALQPKDGAFDSEVESTLAVTLSLDGYAIGSYLVGVRYKDNNGTWGDVLFKTVEVDVDTDGDGLADKAEAYYETNSTRADTDGDGYSDGEEVAFGSDPTDPSSLGNQPPADLNSTAVLAFSENQPVGTIIGEFNATDPDGHAITYSLVPFLPAHLSPALWLDASDEATLVKESGVLSSWLDKSGNNRNGSSTGSSRPSISTGYNGYSMINLDGVDDMVSIDGNFSVNSLFMVLNSLESSTSFPKYSWAFGAGGVANTVNKVPALFGVRNAVSIKSSLPYQGNSQSMITVNGDDAVNANEKNFSPFADIKLVTVSSSQTSSALSNWEIGSGDAYWKGNIAEIVVFDRPLEDHQRYSIEEYLSSKWGLSSKMYHPYVPSNSLFTLDTNGTLKTATAFDYESNVSSYTITVQARDEFNATTESNFTVTLLDLNELPNDLNSTSALTILENQPVGTIIGEFNATDPDGHSITYSLGHQFPSNLNPSLWLDASDLTEAGATWADLSNAGNDAAKVGAPVLAEHQPSGLKVMRYSGSGQYHKFDEITDIRTVFWVLSEDSDATGFGFLLGTTDPNTGGKWHGDNNGNFFSSSYADPKVYYGSTRLNGLSIDGRSTQKPHQLSIVSHVTTGNVNATNFSKDRGWDRFWKGNLGELIILNKELSAAEIASVEQYLGAKWKISVTGAVHSNDGLFSLDQNGTLKSATTFDYESNASSYTITVLAKDELNGITEGNFTITLQNVVEDLDQDGTEDHFDDDIDGDGFTNAQELAYGSDPLDENSVANAAPTDLNTSSNLSILENLPPGEWVAEFNATDSDFNSTLKYSLAVGSGSSGNSFFTIDENGTLRTSKELNYEAKSNHSIRVRVSDEHNASVEKSFIITVEDMDEGTAPTLGDGSEANPYQIHTLAHLKWLSFSHSSHAGKHFIQTNDINASETKAGPMDMVSAPLDMVVTGMVLSWGITMDSILKFSNYTSIDQMKLDLQDYFLL